MTQRREITSGLGVSAGFASGPAFIVQRAPGVDPNETPSTDPQADGQRVREAMASVSRALYTRAESAPESAREVMYATADLAKDKALAKAVDKELNKGRGITAAVSHAVSGYAAMLEQLGGYMAERVTDLFDVRDRLICELRGLPAPGVGQISKPSILIAYDLSPAETAVLDLTKVLGIVTELGGPTSHTAILCAQLGIPAVVRVAGACEIEADSPVAVDGSRGTVIVAPEADELAQMEQRAQLRQELLANSHGPGQTKDGHNVKLLANIGSAADAIAAGKTDVEGCGLFRTEFLFLDRLDAPTYEEQLDTYTKVFTAFSGRRVVVRTLDAGADKPLKFADLGPEENPALGIRGLRLSRVRQDLLDVQLKALADAAAATNADMWVMAPMVATQPEAHWFAERCEEAGIKTVGIMIEVPAAAIHAEMLLTPLSFASIGTNDLAQYTMAADRMQGELAELNSVWQPAVLHLISLACSGAQTSNSHIGICGEAAGDPLLALVLTGLGIQSLSMAPKRIAAVRQSLAQVDLETCRELSRLALFAPDVDTAREAVLAAVPESVLALL
ncbi:phosphoenolpyruvate--protein phosphotransferase [Trueperella sp. LYQ143]|uniref:phosphoenolpyruvate--protein phosphotransferase n=1 Tax=unclassified Trueperella TaxID=2630174 RepID=UPI003983842D